MSAPISTARVLPTLNADGTRRLIRPRLYPGKRYTQRKVVGLALIVLFVVLPWLKISGKPAILLDVVHREFSFFGTTFLATDGVLLMLLMLAIFVAIIWATALVGRAWCGWGCPQTVYMEFIFRPIERLIEGKREAQLRLDKQGVSGRRILKNLVFLLISFVLGNVFLSYFVGVDALRQWMTQAPSEHPTPFLVVAATTGLVFFDFAFFREQMCTVICPYARLQSVLLDPNSLIIAYDAKRGEPRSKGRGKPGNGDCIDCQACVVACPTGIDIREGLQLECVACAQCVDACDSIMDRIAKPRGLIKYASQQSLATASKPKFLRVRTVIYPVILVALVSTLAILISRQGSADVMLLRGLGAPFTANAADVTNQIRIKIQNRSSSPRDYRVEVVGLKEARLIAPEVPLHVLGRGQRTTSVFVVAPLGLFERGQHAIRFRVSDGLGFSEEYPYKLLGPTPTAPARSTQ
jgi:cytochrome c oxidase accessory protein FixG